MKQHCLASCKPEWSSRRLFADIILAWFICLAQHLRYCSCEIHTFLLTRVELISKRDRRMLIIKRIQLRPTRDEHDTDSHNQLLWISDVIPAFVPVRFGSLICKKYWYTHLWNPSQTFNSGQEWPRTTWPTNFVGEPHGTHARKSYVLSRRIPLVSHHTRPSLPRDFRGTPDASWQHWASPASCEHARSPCQSHFSCSCQDSSLSLPSPSAWCHGVLSSLGCSPSHLSNPAAPAVASRKHWLQLAPFSWKPCHQLHLEWYSDSPFPLSLCADHNLCTSWRPSDCWVGPAVETRKGRKVLMLKRLYASCSRIHRLYKMLVSKHFEKCTVLYIDSAHCHSAESRQSRVRVWAMLGLVQTTHGIIVHNFWFASGIRRWSFRLTTFCIIWFHFHFYLCQSMHVTSRKMVTIVCFELTSIAHMSCVQLLTSLWKLDSFTCSA